jgi:hypothetical protein
VTDETPATRLRNAAHYLRDHWTQDQLVRPNGDVCPVGAILGLRTPPADYDDDYSALTRNTMLAADPIARTAVVLLASVIEDDIPAAPGVVAPALIEVWNDEYATDADHVADTMLAAADHWDRQQTGDHA